MIVEPKRFKKLPELFKFYSKIYFKRWKVEVAWWY
jgi:hypothetical protein